MQPTEEAIPLMAYLNRHRRGVFWTLRDDMGGVMGNHWLFRLLLGWAMPPVVWLLKLFAPPALQEEVALKRVYRDDIFHHRYTEAALEKVDSAFDIYPVLMYACKIFPESHGLFPCPRQEDLVPGTGHAIFVDVGQYGISKVKCDPIERMRDMEEYMLERRAVPFLYVTHLMSEAEFGQTFDVRKYEELCKQYGCESDFPTIWEKTATRL